MDLDTLMQQSGKIIASAQEALDCTKEMEEMLQQMVKKTTLLQADTAIVSVIIFVLACFVGYHVISKVSPALHSSLMSVTNAISSVIIVAAIIAATPAIMGLSSFFGGLGIFFAAVNIVGGFVITQRMLNMIARTKNLSS